MSEYTRIGRREKWFNPYYVDVNGKTYEVDSIIIYNKDEILYKSFSGWFENFTGINVIQPSLRRKENFTKGGNFIISKGKEKYDTHPKCILYLEESNDVKFELFENNAICYDNETETCYHDTYKLTIADDEIIVNKNRRIEKKELKLEAEKLAKEFEELGTYNISIYDIVKILKHYNITKKE